MGMPVSCLLCWVQLLTHSGGSKRWGGSGSRCAKAAGGRRQGHVMMPRQSGRCVFQRALSQPALGPLPSQGRNVRARSFEL